MGGKVGEGETHHPDQGNWKLTTSTLGICTLGIRTILNRCFINRYIIILSLLFKIVFC